MEILLTGLGISPLFAARPLLSLVSGWVMLGVMLCFQQKRMPALGNVLLAVACLVLAAVVDGALKAARRKVDGNVFFALASLLVEVALKAVRRKVEELGDHARALISMADRILATVLGVSFTAMMFGHWGQQWVRRFFADAGAGVPGALHPATVSGWTDVLVLGAVGLSIWGFAWSRERLSAILAFLPWSAEPNILRLYGLLESAVCMAGVALAMLWPVAGAVLFAVCATACAVAGVVLRGFEERQKTACEACGVKVHRCARYCPSCSAERVPSRLGLFGRARARKVEDLAAHRLQLLGALRCGRCAQPLSLQGPSSACRRCGAPAFPDAAALDQFVAHADRRWLALVPVLALLGLVPFLGALMGLWLYRVSPAGALGAYARWQDQVSSQLLRQLGLLAIVVLQPLPLVGAGVVPVLVGVLHAQSRRAVRVGMESLARPTQAEAPVLSATG